MTDSTAITDSPGGLWAPERRGLTLGLVITVTLIAAEALAISTAMPIVSRELGRLDLYGWVFSAFFLGSLIGIAIVGELIDDRGVVVTFAAGLGLFAVGLLVGGAAPSMEVLVAARFVQGLGGGALPPVAYVAIGRTLPERLRPTMFATPSTAWILPGILGPAIAGIVAETVGWRWIFHGLLPFIAISGYVALHALRVTAGDMAARVTTARAADRAAAAGAAARRATIGRRRKWAPTVTLGVGAALLMTGLTEGSLVPLVSLVGVGLALTLFALARLTPAGTLRLARGVPMAVVLRGVGTFAFFAVNAYVALLLVEVRGWSAAAAGIALTGATVSWTVGSWTQARLSRRHRPEWFVRRGFPLIALGAAVVGTALIPAMPAWIAIPAFSVAGYGMGLTYAQFALIILRDVPRGEQGSATSGLSLMDALGATLGTGIAGAMIAASVRAGEGPGPGLAVAMAMGAAVAALGFFLATRLDPAIGERPQHVGAEDALG